jgi:uncharacterized repeat protein (TIGR01451 family)
VLPSAATFAAQADLEIWKSGPETVVAGTDLLYEIQVTNHGPDPATDVTVSDVFSLPALGEGGVVNPATCSDGLDNDSNDDIDSTDAGCSGLIYVGATKTCSFTGGTPTEGTVACDLGTLEEGESSTFTIKFHVSPDYLAKKEFFVTNKATVSAAVTVTDSDPSNNSDGLETIVEEVSDLRVSVFVQPGDEALAGPNPVSIAVGATFTYTIYVDNYGPSTARNVTIYDTLVNSDKVSVQSCAFSVGEGGGSITQFTCTTGNLVSTQFGTNIGTMKTNFLQPLTPGTESNGRLRASFRLVANQGMTVTSDTRVTSDTPDPDDTNNQMAVDIDIIPVVDLSTTTAHTSEVQVSGQPGLVVDTGATLPAMPETPNYADVPNEVTAGRRILFSARTKNNGPSRANNVRLEFRLPAGASVLAGTLNPQPTSDTKSGNCYTEPAGEPRTTVICEFGTLYEKNNADEAGTTSWDDTLAEASFQILIDPSVPDGAQLAVDYLARSDEFDEDLSNNGGVVLFDVDNWADLELKKYAVGTPIAGSKTFHYELQVSNQGPSTAHDVTLRDFLPSGISFVSAFIDEEGTGLTAAPLPCGLTTGSNALFCPLGEVPPTGDMPMVVFVNAIINSDIEAGTQLTNTADVNLSDTDDPVPDDNSASVQSTVQAQADLELTKTAPDIVAPSSSISFTLTVKNKGTSDAKDVVVTDTLPPTNQATYVTDSGGCTLAANTLTCPLGTVKNGESKSFNVYMLPKGSKGNITNTASVTSSTADTNSTNNNASKTVLIKGGRVSKNSKK